MVERPASNRPNSIWRIRFVPSNLQHFIYIHLVLDSIGDACVAVSEWRLSFRFHTHIDLIYVWHSSIENKLSLHILDVDAAVIIQPTQSKRELSGSWWQQRCWWLHKKICINQQLIFKTEKAPPNWFVFDFFFWLLSEHTHGPGVRLEA